MRLTCALALGLALAGCHRHPASARAAPRARAASAPDDASGGGGRGANRWKDTGVYLDGKPVAVLSFGELPVTLKPVWVEERRSAEVTPGSHGPGYVIIKQRRYRFVDYLKAVGIEVSKIKELHVAGPRMSETIVVSGAELRSKRSRGFMFRFGGEVGGKAIPVVPNGFGNDLSPDKISAVMIYQQKPPPRLIPNEGLELDGQIVIGIPYAKEAEHGGVRVYLDDQLVGSLHRRNVVERDPVTTDADGTAHYRLFDVLAADGVDTRGVVEAWVIRDERRKEKLTRAELDQMMFEFGQRKQNAILLGQNKLQTQVLALHTKPVRSDQLPQILATESDD